MVFHRPQKRVMYSKIKIHQIEIEQVKEFNFLGIVLNEQLTWKNHTDISPARFPEQMVS